MGLRLGFAKTTTEIGKQEAFAITGTYGKNIRYVFGTRPLDGEPLWFAPIEEIVTKKSKKKGGFLGIGGTKVTTITYDYYATFAVYFGAGPAAKLVRLWLDDLLVFDGADIDTSDPVVIQYPSLLSRALQGSIIQREFSIKQESRIPYRFYRGTEDQEPDAAIVAIEGIANSPAYRGLSYIVFDRLKLQQFDNKVPKVRAEITYDVGGNDITNTETALGTFEPGGNGRMSIDWKRGLIYTNSNDFVSVNLACFDMSGTLIRAVTFASALDNGPTAVDFEQNEYWSTRGTGGDRFNSFTGEIVFNDHTNTKPVQGTSSGTILYAAPGSDTRFCFTSGERGSIMWIIRTHAIDMTNVATTADLPKATSIVSSVVPAAHQDARFGFAYYIASGVFQWVRADGADGSLKTSYTALGASDFGLDSFNVDDLGTLGWDEGNSRVVGFVKGLVGATATTKCFAWSETEGLIWVRTVPFGLFIPDGTAYRGNFPRLTGGVWAWTNGTQLCAVNLGDGTISAEYDGVNNGYFGFSTMTNSQVWDDSTNKMYMWKFNAGGGANDEFQVLQLFLGEQSSSTFANVVRRVASEAGLREGDDFDVSAVEDIIIPGYMISKTQEAKKILEPLVEFYQINVVDRDHRVYFEPRQTSPITTITIDDMVAGRSSAFLREREEESSLPQTFEVEYVDKIRDYEAGIQRASRAKFPVATTNSDNIETFSIDLSLEPNEAKQRVEMLMYAAWIERNAYTFSLPQRWLAHTPGDLNTFVQPSGYTSNIMFDKIGIGANFVMKTHSVEQTQGMYVSFAVSQTGQWTAPPVYLSVPSEPFLLDIPFLTDDDADIDPVGVSIGYWAGSDYGVETNSWPGAFLYRSYDNAVYDQVDVRRNRANWGQLSAAVAAPDSPWATDYVTTIRVNMMSGSLTTSGNSISHDDMLTGLYNRAVICHADDTFELIYFMTVDEIDGRQIELTGLLRGRRGTDTNMVAAAGDRIVFLSDGEYNDNDSNYSFFPNPIEPTLNDNQFYKVVTRGLTLAETLADAFNYTCADLKPYAPDHVEGYQDTLDDITISWVRRTRLGGEMEDLIDVPLSEDTEAYEIDIYNPAGSVVLRTLTSTSETVQYAAAQVLTDQGMANPATIKVGVYQMSASVGRGFGRIVTIEV